MCKNGDSSEGILKELERKCDKGNAEHTRNEPENVWTTSAAEH